jgi:hypothetical protein
MCESILRSAVANMTIDEVMRNREVGIGRRTPLAARLWTLLLFATAE